MSASPPYEAAISKSSNCSEEAKVAPGAKRRMLNDRSGLPIGNTNVPSDRRHWQADNNTHSPSSGGPRSDHPTEPPTSDEAPKSIKPSDNSLDSHHRAGGRVLLLRNLAQTVVEHDVETFVSPFTRSATPKIYLQFAAGQAFVEFGTSQEASDAYRYFKAHPTTLKNQTVQVFFSDRDYVTAPDEKNSNFRVLLATVTNLMYPVDIELLRFLFTRFGRVQKIISFSKANSASTFQALVEMADPQMAMDALKELHGRNIYDGCNTLQIQPSRLPELLVRVNNSRAWDYTVAPEGVPPRAANSSAEGQKSRTSPHVPPRGVPDENQMPPGNGNSLAARCSSPGFVKVLGMPRLPREAREWKAALLAQSVVPSPVLIVYNLTPNAVTVNELFNVFSLYGVLLRIKILRDKPHTALLQYSDPLYASLAAHFLQGSPLFELDPGMQIGFSRNAEVKLSSAVGPDTVRRTRAFLPQEQRYNVADYSTPDLPNEVEKFIRAACAPTCTLFIANLRENVEGFEIRELIGKYGTVTKVQMKAPTDGSRRRYAMVEVSSRHEALYALAHLHNSTVDGQNIKVAFSKVVISDNGGGTGESPEGRPTSPIIQGQQSADEGLPVVEKPEHLKVEEATTSA